MKYFQRFLFVFGVFQFTLQIAVSRSIFVLLYWSIIPVVM